MALDRDAEFTRFVGERTAWLRKVAFLLCQDWHRADDLVQTTITQAYVHWRRVRSADDQDAYVRRMLVNAFLAERRAGWLSRVSLTAQPPERPGHDPDATTGIALRAALAEIPPRQRAALVLRYFCDLTVEDTADALGCSIGTVKSQTARGLVALRKAWPAPAAPGME